MTVRGPVRQKEPSHGGGPEALQMLTASLHESGGPKLQRHQHAE